MIIDGGNHNEVKHRMMRMIPSPVKRLAPFTIGHWRYNALGNLYLLKRTRPREHSDLLKFRNISAK